MQDKTVATPRYAELIQPPHYNGWRARVAVTDLLEAAEEDPWGDFPDETVQAIGAGITVRLRALQAIGYANDSDLSQIVEEFDCIGQAPEGEWPEDWTRRQDFDARLRDLYDWADAKRVIVGGALGATA